MAASLHDTGVQLNIARKMVLNFSPQKEKSGLVSPVIWWNNRRISLLIGKWLLNGWCRETIFNLKLPMKNVIKK